MISPDQPTSSNQVESLPQVPAISLPKGGGAIRGIGEKFAANPVTGTGSLIVPIATSPGRGGLAPQLALSYDSGAGNGPFGFGWNLSLPAITRQTDRGLPQYNDAAESDGFILSGAEDLVPVLRPDGTRYEDRLRVVGYRIHRYRPRREGLFARIERWTRERDGDVHWRSISRDNVLTLYGVDASSRIADPANPQHVFSWLICETRDDKGNAIVYDYKPEDGVGVDLSRPYERNRGDRNDSRRTANRYLKTIRYGNRIPLLENPGHRPTFLASDHIQNAGWMFEVVFDYGEHDANTPAPQDNGPWTYRGDPFSSCRAGFEVRTTRLCQRVLMFHHFPNEDGVGNNCLVRATEFTYTYEEDPTGTRNPIYTFLRAVKQSGFRRRNGSYIERSLPALAFEYSQPTVQDTLVPVEPASLENLPSGVDGAVYHWTDLHGEGLPGILSEQANAWFYKRNLSPISRDPVAFAAMERVAEKPNLLLSPGQWQFMDLAGDGQPDIVMFEGPLPGLFEHDNDEGWQPFRAFGARLNRSLRDPNLRWIDLDGDGHADVLITEDDAFVWYISQAETGFGPAQRAAQVLDEELGPRLVFDDGTQSIYLADLNGDGLTDLVRIRNGEVCYWPNLGFGRFGAKITMDHAPYFDHPDQFDQQRIRLADIDGSGTTDILYLHRDGVLLFFNQSGNGWSEACHLRVFPRLDDLATVTAVDLMGNGTACLVWSVAQVGDGRSQMCFVDLMGGVKPHLLVKIVNNLGAETCITYASSTRFYLQDKRDGKPWISRLPFPVHVVERIETNDLISHNRFVTRYAYHHGYFDGVEREFGGFGLVEQWDTEMLAALASASNEHPQSYVPPVLTRTWYHTGVYADRQHVSDYFAGLRDANDCGEYYREPGSTDAAARRLLLDDTILPAGLSDDEAREACRALRGTMLRQEMYALDASDREPHPYAVTEQNFEIRRLQPQVDNRHAVFFTHSREIISYHYERQPADPRIGHALTLSVDEYGNVLRSAAIGYGRRQPDPALSTIDQAQQAQLHVTIAEHTFTNPIDQDDDYRVPQPAAAQTYELTGLPSGPDGRFAFDDVAAFLDAALTIPYLQAPDPTRLQKRLIEHVRTHYRPNDLGAATDDALALLPCGVLESHALAGETYRLAFAPDMVAGLYDRRVTPDMLKTAGGYVDAAGDGGWWMPSGRVLLSPAAGDAPAHELAWARAHFFTPQRSRDAFGHETTVITDAYDLLSLVTRDAIGNTVTAVNDYRTLRARLVTDPNGNQSAAAFDALGLVVGTAVMGKPGENLGDSLAGFEPDLPEADVLAYLTNPLADPHAILQGATTRFVYDLFAYQRTRDDAQPAPMVVGTLLRETHLPDLAIGAVSRVQHRFSYIDGFGREIQKKLPAEPGLLSSNDPIVDPRWVGSGWTVFDNKGKPVRQFEPFFTGTHRFEYDVRHGVGPILGYDPMQRVVVTCNPNHTWQKTVVDAWCQTTWDVNDTVLIEDPATDADVGDFFGRLAPADYLPTWYGQRIDGALGVHEQRAAVQTSVHANTPTVTYLDSLGRSFLVVVHQKLKGSDTPPEAPPIENLQPTRVIFDIEGNQRAVVDALARVVMQFDYDMLGNLVHTISMDAGERWMLNDATRRPIYAWDQRGHVVRTEYDALRRPVGKYVSGRDAAQSDVRVFGRDVMFEKIEYGEGQVDDTANNLRTRVWQACDGAGITTSEAYDFKGNLLRGSRQLTRDYKNVPDWSAAVALEDKRFASHTIYDALNRPVMTTAPDGSVLRSGYNEANLLQQFDVNLRGDTHHGTPKWTPFVTNVDYNARGQRTSMQTGNGVTTTYTYDPLTFRLQRLSTWRDAAVYATDCPADPPAGWPGCALQNLHYTYDPIGNLTHMQDDAQQTIYFRNQRVEPAGDYVYDATYQLIEASGREHLGQAGGVPYPPTPPDGRDLFHRGLPHPGDGHAMGRYLESYVYDAVGNMVTMQHRGSDPAQPGWTRTYTYAEPSLNEPGQVNNRLSTTQVGAGLREHYTYDGHGSTASMSHLPFMSWSFLDQLVASSQQVVTDGTPETTYYVYDAAGQRVRKVTERRAGAGAVPARKSERIYLGNFEVYCEYGGDGSAITLERETLHIMDGQQRIALVETRTLGDDGSAMLMVRYQITNHLGSAAVELDETGRLISYEEYFPYGSTSYQAADSTIRALAKRYRYTGRERDEETGLAYHGARYYANWHGRWISCDPAGLRGGQNLYEYAANNPMRLIDTGGKQPFDPYAYLVPPSDFDVQPPERWDVDIRKLVQQQPEFVMNKIMPTLFKDIARAEIERTITAPKWEEVEDPLTGETTGETPVGMSTGYMYEWGREIRTAELGYKYHGNKCAHFVHATAYATGVDNPVKKDIPGQKPGSIFPPHELIDHAQKVEAAGFIEILFQRPAGFTMSHTEIKDLVYRLQTTEGILIGAWGPVRGHGHTFYIEGIDPESSFEDELWFSVIEAGAHRGENTRPLVPPSDRSVLIFKLTRLDSERIIDQYQSSAQYREAFNNLYWKAHQDAIHELMSGM